MSCFQHHPSIFGILYIWKYVHIYIYVHEYIHTYVHMARYACIHTFVDSWEILVLFQCQRPTWCIFYKKWNATPPPPTYIWKTHFTHMNASNHTHERVTSCIRTSHATHPWIETHTHQQAQDSSLTPAPWVSHYSRMNEPHANTSRHTLVWVICHTFVWVICHAHTPVGKRPSSCFSTTHRLWYFRNVDTLYDAFSTSLIRIKWAPIRSSFERRSWSNTRKLIQPSILLTASSKNSFHSGLSVVFFCVTWPVYVCDVARYCQHRFGKLETHSTLGWVWFVSVCRGPFVSDSIL